MISLTTAQLDAWMAAFIFPLVRVLAFFASAPLWSTAGVPRRVRLLVGVAVTVAIIPILPPMPKVAPASLAGLAVLAQQMLTGVAMGFCVRVIFAAVEVAGDFSGMQMGLGFATAYDPLSSSQTPVLSEFLSLISLLLFLSMNGHLMMVATLAQSFTVMPIGQPLPGSASWLNIAELGGILFSTALLISLPVVVAVMITNIALAVLTRAAPQLNIFSLGFPMTLMGGFFALAISMNYLAVPLQNVYEVALRAMTGFAVRGGG